MLELGIIRNEKDRVIEGFNKRNLPQEAINQVDTLIELDNRRKQLQTSLDTNQSEVNILSKEIGELFKSGQKDLADQKKEMVAKLKEDAKANDEEYKSVKDQIENILLQLPNVPYKEVDAGKDAEDNFVFKAWTEEIIEPIGSNLPHWELADKYNLFSLSLGVQITGAGFPVYRGKGARLQRSLISFFLDEAINAGYEEIIPPLLVNKESARATGQLPDKDGQMYYCEKDDLYLIPTAEVPVTNIYRDTIVQKSELPIKLTGYTPCFRREAGSYGADVKGLNRVHQFDKVEIVQITHPDQSYHTLMDMIGHVESILKKLELPYRILRLCGGDMGFASAMTYDFEVYSVSQKRWLEVSSVSNFETFQTNRMMLRFKDDDGKNRLAHTLNGSALALARIVAAILEKYQTSDGIVVPQVLRKYTGFDLIN